MSLERFKRPRLLDKNEARGEEIKKPKKVAKKASGRSITKKKKK